jgi:hypothetical protein
MEELERYKAAWQKRPMEQPALASGTHISRSLPFLRTSAIRDLQRSEEVSRFIFVIIQRFLICSHPPAFDSVIPITNQPSPFLRRFRQNTKKSSKAE